MILAISKVETVANIQGTFLAGIRAVLLIRKHTHTHTHTHTHIHTHTHHKEKISKNKFIPRFQDDSSSPLGGHPDGQTHRGVTSFNNIDSGHRPAA